MRREQTNNHRKRERKLTPKEETLVTEELNEEIIPIEEVNREIAKAIREERKKAGLSTQELSKRIGRSPSYINKLENNRLDISTEELVKIAKALHLTPGYFFPGILERKFGIKIGRSTLDIIAEIKERINILEMIEKHREEEKRIELEEARKRELEARKQRKKST